MRVAYADPPYPHQGIKYPERQEVDHGELIERLEREFPDGWALSTSASTLQEVLALCPPSEYVGRKRKSGTGVRVGIWCKTNAMPTPSQRITWSWEAVIYKGGRWQPNNSHIYVRDYLVAATTSGFLGATIIGEKPREFCFWLFKLLGLQSGDEFVDLFPGSGSVTKWWSKWSCQP